MNSRMEKPIGSPGHLWLSNFGPGLSGLSGHNPPSFVWSNTTRLLGFWESGTIIGNSTFYRPDSTTPIHVISLPVLATDLSGIAHLIMNPYTIDI
jgi:hypothetical protein